MSEGKSLIDVVEEFEQMLRRVRKDVRHSDEMYPREAAECIDTIREIFKEAFTMAINGNTAGAVERLRECWSEIAKEET